MNKTLRTLLCVPFFIIPLQSCFVKDTLTGSGIGEITPLGGGEFDIAVAGSLSGNRSTIYEKWDRTAIEACKGGKYKIVKRDWQSVEYPGILGGIIKCR